MFDYLKCEYPLPDPEYQDATFQTKDFDCCLETYTITKDGRLMVHRITHRSAKPEELDPLPEDWDDLEPQVQSHLKALNKIFGGLVVDREWDELIPYHGDVYFYDFHKSGHGLVTFKARFTEGRVVYIVKVGSPPPAR